MSATPQNPIISLSQSPNAKLYPFPVRSIQITDAFWKRRMDNNFHTTLHTQHALLESTGRINNFRRVAGTYEGSFQGRYYNDSDVYKWLEAASYALVTHPNSAWQELVASVSRTIVAAQDSDGYLNTYYQFERKGERYTNLRDMHEIYCGGHFIQAAIAHHRATGDDLLLKAAIRLADHWHQVFGDEEGKRPGTCGHPEAEMALVELYRETGNTDFLQLAHQMIAARGRKENPVLGGRSYHQDHEPVLERTEMVGHAVRDLYLFCGVADLVAELSGTGYEKTLETVWNNFTQRKMYVTGGAGARYDGEAFGENYELPNDRAYAETCAAIASFMWNWRMLHLNNDAKYADLMELTLYNAILPSLSLSGTEYFYENPLQDSGKHRRAEWFDCACCPPNISRLLASLSGYLYSEDADGNLYLHQYISNQADLVLRGGSRLQIHVESSMPYQDAVKIHIQTDSTTPRTLFLRIPVWARGGEIGINGNQVNRCNTTSGYADYPVEPHSNTTLDLKLNITTTRILCNPKVTNNRNAVALQRGALVYCIEQVDQPDIDLMGVTLSDDAELRCLTNVGVMGEEHVLLKAKALCKTDLVWESTLYLPYPIASEVQSVEFEMTAIPYYLWANRSAGAMTIWINRE